MSLLLALTMAVTFDDLPAQGIERGSVKGAKEINAKIVATLKARKIPGVAFVNEQGLETDGKVDPKRVASLTLWLDAGMEMGNHTYSHPSLHKVPLEQYLGDIDQGERVTRPMVESRGGKYVWFRHPFLQTGRDLDTKHAVVKHLADRGYRVAPVTIDNSEWVYARAYAVTKDAATRKKLGASYVAYMLDVVAYYEKQSELLFQRQIPQVLLVHANSLNAEYFDELADAIAARGYRWVSLADAVADEAYSSEDKFTGNGGITWLHRWALTRGGMELIVPGEPTVPEWVQSIADAR